MKIVSILFLVFITSAALPQARRDAVWCFGDSVKIDFNQQPPAVSWSSNRDRGTACSIADSLGNILFYCHTDYIPLWQQGYDKLGVIWNRNNEIMENGDSLVGDGWYHEMVIMPNVLNNNQYYLFHTGVSLNGQLYYSVIDLSFNNGLGKVIQKNVLLDSLNGEQVTDGLTAIKHANGRDWWIVFRSYGSNSNAFHRYLITPFSINHYPDQNIGALTVAGFLRLKFNNQGNKLLLFTIGGLLETFDFDRCSGNISNYKQIHPEYNSVEDFFWGAEFSPNDSLIYVTTGATPTYLYQFNLYASDVYASKIILDSFNFPITSASDLKLAIDGKIYRSNPYITGNGYFFPYPDSIYNNYNMNLSVINNPNILGAGCDYLPYSFSLGGKRTYVGLPNNPYYDMPALGGSVCDSLGLPNGIKLTVKKNISVFPNPVRDKIYFGDNLNLNEGDSKAFIKVNDFTGKLVIDKQLKENFVDVSGLSQGIYAVTFFINGFYQSSVKVAIVK